MSVTLKELRISKGLNQAQCAEYLGMSTRNYQNYENDAAKANTARYHAIYQKLESYGQPVVSVSLPSQTPEFYTNVSRVRACGRWQTAWQSTASVTASAPCRSLWPAPTMGRSVFYTVSAEPERQHFCFKCFPNCP